MDPFHYKSLKQAIIDTLRPRLDYRLPSIQALGLGSIEGKVMVVKEGIEFLPEAKNVGGVNRLPAGGSQKNCGARRGCCCCSAELLRLVRKLQRLSPPVPVDEEDPPLDLYGCMYMFRVIIGRVVSMNLPEYVG